MNQSFKSYKILFDLYTNAGYRLSGISAANSSNSLAFNTFVATSDVEFHTGECGREKTSLPNLSSDIPRLCWSQKKKNPVLRLCQPLGCKAIGWAAQKPISFILAMEKGREPSIL